MDDLDWEIMDMFDHMKKNGRPLKGLLFRHIAADMKDVFPDFKMSLTDLSERLHWLYSRRFIT